MSRPMIGALAALLALTPMTALAGPAGQGQFALSATVGADFPIEGDVHGGRTTAALPLSAVAPLLTPVPTLPGAATAAQLRIEARSYDEIYGEALNLGLEGAYGLGGGREAFGAVGLIRAEEGSTRVGSAALLDAGGNDLAVVPVFGSFGDYQAVTIEGGVRQFFGADDQAVRPYVAGRIGAAFVDEIRAKFTIPALNLTQTLNNAAFYDASTTLTAGLDVGVAFKVSPTVSIAAETGLRYVGALQDDDSTVAGLDLASINDEGERISVPVALRARVAF